MPINTQTIKKYAQCQNCSKLMGCNNSISRSPRFCKDFKLYGSAPENKPTKSKNLCGGCYNQFYDRERSGCWSYKTAKVVLNSNIYSLTQAPPWSLGWKLSCFRRQY